MTPVFCCGFECGIIGTVVGNGEHWRSISGTAATISTSTVRSGARSIRVNLSAQVSYTSTNSGAPSISAGISVHRFYIRFATLPNADTLLYGMGFSGVVALGLGFKSSDNTLRCLTKNTTYTLGSTGVVVTTGVWYLIDMKLDNTSGAKVVDGTVDGVAMGQATGSGTGTALTVGIGSDATVTCDFFIDDVVISNTSGDYPIMGGYINHFVPTSDGTHNVAGAADFQRTLTGTDILNATTTAFQLVDEIPFEAVVTDWINMIAPPNATDYVECIFGPAPGINTPTVAPRTVEVICGINQAGTGTGNMEIRLNDNGTTGIIYTATTVAGVAVATGQVFKRAHFVDPPSAASVWTLSGNGDFNNVRIRFGSPAAVDANPDQYFGCAMIEAEFAPIVAVFIAAKPFIINQAVNRSNTY